MEAAHTAPSADDVSWVTVNLPCARCREADALLDRLPSTRLGKHERRVLLAAGPPAADEYAANAAWPRPDGDSRAALKAQQRAIRKLVLAGLLLTKYVEIRVKHEVPWEWQRYKGVYLTTFGQIVVDQVAPALRDASRIRWADHLDVLRTSLRPSAPELVEEFLLTLVTEIPRWRGEAGLALGVGSMMVTKAAAAERVLAAFGRTP